MKNLLFICTTPRTGSSLLVADMRSTGAMGHPREYFNLTGRYKNNAEKWGLDFDDLDGHIASLRKRTASPNGVVGIKIFERHLDQMALQGLLPRGPGRLRALSERFGEPEPVIITLFRRNKLRQAISFTKAKQTGKWGVLRKAKADPKYDQKALANDLVELVRRESRWERELEDSGYRPHLELIYEDLVPGRESVLLRIAELLELPDPGGVVAARSADDVRLERQADDLTEVWFDQFIEWRRR
jgi:LPS sulfotransferase NodH